MNWLNKKIKNALQELMFAKSNQRNKEEIIPVRRINCYDEIEIIYIKKVPQIDTI